MALSVLTEWLFVFPYFYHSATSCMSESLSSAASPNPFSFVEWSNLYILPLLDAFEVLTEGTAAAATSDDTMIGFSDGK